MESSHKTILGEIVAEQECLARALGGSSIFVTGASGFLAASLLAFLDKLRKHHGVQIELAASARRPPSEVPLFGFLGTKPYDCWQVAPVEQTQPPGGRRWIVVHTASFGSPVDYMRAPFTTFSANTKGIENFFDPAGSLKMEAMVYFSSAEVYGQPPDVAIPTKESFCGGPNLENPRSIYAESKRMGEVLGRAFSKKTGVPFVSLRPWNVYGPGQRLKDGRVPMEFLRQMKTAGRIRLLSDGSPTRSFCHVWEAMPQIATCLRPGPGSHSVFNIGSQGTETSIRELATLCAGLFGKGGESVSLQSNSEPQAMLRCQPDTSRISQLQVVPQRKIALCEGLETCLEWVEFLGNQT